MLLCNKVLWHEERHVVKNNGISPPYTVEALLQYIELQEADLQEKDRKIARVRDEVETLRRRDERQRRALRVQGARIRLHQKRETKYADNLVRVQFDLVTGLKARNLLQPECEHMLRVAQRQSSEVSLLILDLDHFKTINDSYGHPFGDKILKRFGELFLPVVRDSDLLGRWGGEEFLIFLNASMEQAEIIAERYRKMVEQHLFVMYGEKKVSVTVSIGIATFDPQIHADETFEVLVERADAALYQAKRKGRNKVKASRP